MNRQQQLLAESATKANESCALALSKLDIFERDLNRVQVSGPL
jgi:hypothetical protein